MATLRVRTFEHIHRLSIAEQAEADLRELRSRSAVPRRDRARARRPGGSGPLRCRYPAARWPPQR